MVLSVGGNDALGHSGLLGQAAATIGDAIAVLDQARARFREDYQRTLHAVAGTGLPVAVCTIYDANYPAPLGSIVAAALSLFNDVITRAAFALGLDVIDLRLICSDPSHYANPIEPSAKGGEKIASTIAAFCLDNREPDRQSKVWVDRDAAGQT